MKQIIYPVATKASGTGTLEVFGDKYDPRYIQALDEYRQQYAAMQGLKSVPSRATVQMEHFLRSNPAVKRRYNQLIKESGHGRKYIYPDTTNS